MKRKTLFWWFVRLLALSAVIFVLSSQIQLDDTLELGDGSVLTGSVTRTTDGDWQVVGPDERETIRVPDEDVALRGGDEAAVPAVSWGLRTLGGRLGGHLPVVVLVLAILASLLALTAVRWHLLLRTVDLRIPLARAIRLTWIGAFFNLAVPGATGGDVVKAWYAARETGRATRSVLSVFVDRMLGMIGMTLVAGAALWLAPFREGFGPARAVITVALGICVVATVVLGLPKVRSALGWRFIGPRLPFQTLIAEAGAALQLYRGHPVGILVALGLSVVNHVANTFCAWLLAGALGIEGLDLATAFALVPVANFFAGIPILPGGWGVGELAFAFFLGQVGIPPTEAVGLSVVYRLSILAVSLPGGLLWAFWKDRPTRAEVEATVHSAAHDVEEREHAEWGTPDV